MTPERLPEIKKYTDWVPHTLTGEKRRAIYAAKKHPCMDCGIKYPVCVMDFDHVRGDKLFNIAQCDRKGVTLEMVYAEIAKCDLVCANCHRLRTYQ